MNKQLKLPIKATSEYRGDHWAAKSDPFAITVYGATPEEAETRLMAAIDLFLRSPDERGKLEEYLTAHQVPFVLLDPNAPPVPRSYTRDLVIGLAA